MAIAIVDLDLIKFRQSYFLNLDVMQIMAYYKKRNETVYLSKTDNYNELLWYETIYLIYNGDKVLDLQKFIQDDRVILVGKYFYGNNNVLPLDILNTFPDTTVYDNLLSSDFFSVSRMKQLRGYRKKSDFLRLHIPSNLSFITNESKQLVFYDNDIKETDLGQILSFNKKFSFYNPITVTTFKQAKKWIDAKAFSTLYTTTQKYIFNASNFPLDDLKQVLDCILSTRMLFQIIFGDCSPEYYRFDYNKFLDFIYMAKPLGRHKPRIAIKTIANPDYAFLYDIGKQWYNGGDDKECVDLFHYYFKKPEHFKIAIRLKAREPELYNKLLIKLRSS